MTPYKRVVPPVDLHHPNAECNEDLIMKVKVLISSFTLVEGYYRTTEIRVRRASLGRQDSARCKSAKSSKFDHQPTHLPVASFRPAKNGLCLLDFFGFFKLRALFRVIVSRVTNQAHRRSIAHSVPYILRGKLLGPIASRLLQKSLVCRGKLASHSCIRTRVSGRNGLPVPFRNGLERATRSVCPFRVKNFCPCPVPHVRLPVSARVTRATRHGQPVPCAPAVSTTANSIHISKFQYAFH